MPAHALTDSWMLGSLRVPNRVMLAPLAGIGNWFVRLQAKRYGAGMAVSEMVSSHAIHYGNEKTCTEMLRIDPRERAAGPVSIQLFGEDPAMMRSAAAHVARVGRRRDRHQHGLPGAEGAEDRRRRGAAGRSRPRGRGRAGGGRGRRGAAGRPAGDGQAALGPSRRASTSGFELAHRLVAEAGVAAIAFHPALGRRPAQGRPRLRARGAPRASRCPRR